MSLYAFFLLLSLVNCYTINIDIDSELERIDFKNMHGVLTRLLAGSDSPTLPCRSLNETIPPSTVMFTYSNHEGFDMVLMQQESMDFWKPGLKNCLNTIFLVICVDAKCFEKCKEQSGINCALVDYSKTMDQLPRIYHYFFLCYIKHHLMDSILMTRNDISAIFFFDADVLIFRNPLSNLGDLNEQENAYVSDISHDLLFQEECGFGSLTMKCLAKGKNDVNSGQLYLRKSEKVAAYFDYIKSRKEQIIFPKPQVLDQQFILPAAQHAGMTLCGMNRYHYTSACQVVNCKSNDDAAFNGIVTLHLACVAHSIKMQYLRLVITRGRENPDWKMGQILQQI